MTRTARTRTSTVPFGSGSRIGAVNNVAFSGDATTLPMRYSTMDDYKGRPVKPSPMSKSSSDKSQLELVHGAKGSPTDPTWYVYDNFPIGRYGTDYNTAVQLSWPHGHSSTFGTEILAKTNPSRPDYGIGTMIQDLVNLPRMIRDVGDAFKRGFSQPADKLIANQYLGAKFGWIPLYDDLSKLLDVNIYIDRRNSELDRLFSGRGLKRRVGLGKHTQTHVSTQFVSSGATGTLTAKAEQISHRELWGTARWKPTIPPQYYPSDSERLLLAKRTVLGATASGTFANSWDLIPWTWMLGWVTNVRSYVLAHGNTVPAAPSAETCVMIHTESSRNFTVTSRSAELRGGEGTIYYDEKFRNVHSKASVSAYLPYLDGGRLSVLGALAVQRFR